MDASNQDRDDFSVAKGYALTGKIMLSAIVVLFFVVITMVCLHLYARWYLLTARRRHLRRRTRRPHLVFVVDPPNNPAVPSRGLDAVVLKNLPVFVYGSGMDPIECAVCLSEFEEKESGRTLPKCNHSFHIECIDMWFQSHATCPLCRSPVEPLVPQNQAESSSSGLCAPCQHDGVASTSSFNESRKPPELIGITIEVPRRNGGFDDDTATGSPSSYRSPMSRMLSFTRILSRERRGNAPSPSYVESPNVLDAEKGRVETSGSQIKIGGDSVQS